MKLFVLAIAATLIMTGCSMRGYDAVQYPGPYCTSSYRTVCGGYERNDIQVTWTKMNCSVEAAVDTIECMCRSNTLPGVRFSGSPDIIYVTVNCGEIDFEIKM